MTEATEGMGVTGVMEDTAEGNYYNMSLSQTVNHLSFMLAPTGRHDTAVVGVAATLHEEGEVLLVEAREATLVLNQGLLFLIGIAVDTPSLAQDLLLLVPGVCPGPNLNPVLFLLKGIVSLVLVLHLGLL